ncbi:MAG: hypothetical protein JWP02_2264 [Acidimicrobiales bacterium]|nr:hypothetical protein [Acidimicrobiales bacterium]
MGVKYDDILAVLRVVREHESSTDQDAVCNPCVTAGLAYALGLEPQEIADRLSDALARGHMITARKTTGDTEPYYDQIKLSANGRAAAGRTGK